MATLLARAAIISSNRNEAIVSPIHLILAMNHTVVGQAYKQATSKVMVKHTLIGKGPSQYVVRHLIKHIVVEE